MKDIKTLEVINLTKNERKVYLSLLESGTCTVSELSKKSELHRSYVYDILDKLLNLGLIGMHIRNNKKHFESWSPERILEILNSKERAIKVGKENIRKILPKLKKRFKIKNKEQTTRIFIGKEGIKSVLEDILTTKQDFRAFGAEGKFKDIFKWYFKNWQKRRAKARIKCNIIYSKGLKRERPTPEQRLVNIKYVDKMLEFPATTIVYGNKIAIIIWEPEPAAFLLESNQAVKSFNNYFDILWESAEP